MDAHGLAPTIELPGNSGGWAALLAGARARGLAEGLDWLGLAAVLIDDCGEALHVNARAADLLGGALFLDGGRLRARDSRADCALVQALCDALTLTAPRSLRIGGDEPLLAHVAPIPADPEDPYRQLRAVAVLRRDRGG